MKVSITEIEINRVLVAGLPPDAPVANVSARVTPAGITVTGEYYLMFTVPFRTEWLLQAVAGGLEAHLRDLQVGGLPASKFRGLLLKLIRDAIKDPAVRVEGERVWLDVPGALRLTGVPLRADVTVVRCLDTAVEVEIAIGRA
jgi:hypothetical protein